MKLVIITGAYTPFMNGVTTSILNTERALRARGWDVLVISPRTFEKNPDAPRNRWKESFPCPGYDVVRLVKPTFRNIRKFFSLLDDFTPDTIHISTECPLGLMGKYYAYRRKLRYTTAYHTRFPEIAGQIAREKFYLPYGFVEKLGYAYMRAFHRSPSGLMVSLQSLKQELESRGFRNLKLWSRGIDHSVFRMDGERIDLGPSPVFIHYGRLSIDKGFPEFCRLKLPGTMVAVGEGPERDVLRWKKEFPHVRFFGRADGDMRGMVLRSADVMIFGSVIDTFGIVTIEANACGTPVAAVNHFPHTDLIKNGANGWVDDNLTVAALQCAAFTPEMRAACARSACEYTWERATDQFAGNLVPARRA
ncbi:glycosyltransferase [bacterium]|nr:glycosyltransferase [bacterium]MCI0565813.1 glycosyltransferase [bacterium]